MIASGLTPARVFVVIDQEDIFWSCSSSRRLPALEGVSLANLFFCRGGQNCLQKGSTICQRANVNCWSTVRIARGHVNFQSEAVQVVGGSASARASCQKGNVNC